LTIGAAVRGTTPGDNTFGWLDIVRLGAVQAALGAVVVLTTSTFNRLMVVELALAATVPGALVTLHHAMQLLRPRMGHGTDIGGRRTPWILLGMVALALGGIGAAAAISLMAVQPALGLALAVVSYAAIGGGVSACGTSLLVLLAKGVAAPRRAAATTVVWMMMIAGFAVTAGVAGGLLEPFSYARLIGVTAGVSTLAVVIAFAAMRGVESRIVRPAASPPAPPPAPGAFRRALAQVWSEPDARRFTAFVLVSMLAYSAQDLILEPFAGLVFGWSPGASTKLAGTQHAGVFLGMLLVAVVTSAFKGRGVASLKGWVVGGCVASALTMSGLAFAGLTGAMWWPLAQNVFLLGVANGAFSIAAIAAMMTLSTHGRSGREGMRMGLWGAAQAIAFGAGGFLGTVLVDAAQGLAGQSSGLAYAFVFALEAIGFVVAARLALRTTLPEHGTARAPAPPPSPQPAYLVEPV
jgi:MFS transporter, BCD family, chlorophyll transporter